MLKDFLDRLFRKPEEWDGGDRRESLRAPCDFELELACPGLRYLAKAVNLSPRGIRLKVRGPWNPKIVRVNAEAQLKYLTPIFDAEFDTVKGSIRWVKKEAENLFTLAVAFEDDVDRLKRSWVKSELMKHLRSRVKQNRKQLRVRLNLPARFIFNGQDYEGHLRDISTGGARLEAFQIIPEGTQLIIQVGPVKPLPQLRLKAVVRRVTKEMGTMIYGLAFQYETADQKSTVLQYVKQVVELRKS